VRGGVLGRALEYLFESMLGMGPMHYIRALQLHAIRRALLTEETACESIGGVAPRYGIWHWSKFSAAYRRMFDQLPSQTRSRALL
jgi:AraC family transcriptional regulator, ethanolamine operon transcriptional activator